MPLAMKKYAFSVGSGLVLFLLTLGGAGTRLGAQSGTDVATDSNASPADASVQAGDSLQVDGGLLTGKTNRATEIDFPPGRPKIEIQLNAGGATATNGGQGYHTVDFDGNLNHTDAIVVNLPQNQKLRGHVTAISVIDASGKRTFLAQVKDCAGEINQETGKEVVYRNAFDTLNADVIYRYGQTYFEQFVVFRSQFALPEGVDEQTAQIEVWSEFFNPPTPRKLANNIKLRNSTVKTVMAEDDTLDFGWMKMAEGRAFVAASTADGETLPVAKAWIEADGGRKFLIETADYLSLKPMLNQLPRAAAITPKTDFMMAQNAGPVPQQLPAKRSLQPLRMAATDVSRPSKGEMGGKRLALASPGVAVDFILLNSALINIDFGASTTSKTGPAVVGKTTSDYWNTYSAADPTNKTLYLSDGTASGATLYRSATITNASFPVSCGEVMYDTYVTCEKTYSLIISNLPSGVYHVYIYGHGPATNLYGTYLVGTTLRYTAAGGFWSAFTGWVQGAHYVEINKTVTAGSPLEISVMSSDHFTVINGLQIVAADNLPPYVEAGPDAIVQYGSQATLNGVADDDGLPVSSTVSVNWKKLSGPGSVVFTNSASLTTAANFSAPGTYVLCLSANDSAMFNEDTVSITVQQGLVWDLQTGWSDTANPNGVWTYRESTNALPHTASWCSNQNAYVGVQPAWAYNGANNFLPGWLKASVPTTFTKDYQIGDVVVHSTDSYNGVGHGVANVVWTSPISGYVTIVGGVWLARDIGRANYWELYYKNSLISTGYVYSGDSYCRTNPFNFSAGSGGPSALIRLAVTNGDQIQLNLVKKGALDADFVGVNLSIVQDVVVATEQWDLKADWSDTQNPNGAWSYLEGSDLLPHVSAWTSAQGSFNGNQPAWAVTANDQSFLPAWFKSTVTPTFTVDWQIGDVITHALEPNNCCGLGNGEGSVVWTSPFNGTINLSGSAWLGRKTLGRSDKWTLLRGTNVLSTGQVLAANSYSRSNPFYFVNGSGGPGVLHNLPINKGETIRLLIEKVPSSTAEFMGVDFTITKATEIGDTDNDGLAESSGLSVQITAPKNNARLP
jgi:hypothetical protein